MKAKRKGKQKWIVEFRHVIYRSVEIEAGNEDEAEGIFNSIDAVSEGPIIDETAPEILDIYPAGG
jgi:hypothetical protein